MKRMFFPPLLAETKRKFLPSLVAVVVFAVFAHDARGQSASSVVRTRDFRARAEGRHPAADSGRAAAVRTREFRAPVEPYELASLVWKLREVGEVSSRAVGFGGRKGEFFKLSEEILRVGKEADFERMVEDENVVVKVMGLVCLAQRGDERGRELLRLHSLDPRPVRAAVGCIRYGTTVGEIARRLLAEPDFLGHDSRKAAHY